MPTQAPQDLTRREFLKQGMAVVSLGVAVPGVFARAAAAAAAERSAGTGRTLVVVQLAGGLDGLNTVVPYADPAYRDVRAYLAMGEEDLLPLADGFALHPALGGFKQLFDEGKLAVVQGAGYPDPSFSHFKAMDIWQSADPEGVGSTGWLGRYFDGIVDQDGHPLAGLSVGRGLPSAFEAERATLPSVSSIESFTLQPVTPRAEARQASLVSMYDLYRPTGTPFAALLDTTLDSAIASSAALNAAHEVYEPGVTYPESSLASGLRLLAELIDSQGGVTPLRVGHVTLGGFDTHTQQETRLEALLQELGDALAAFWADVSAHGHGGEVVVMTWSEFGRRVKGNAQDGTDHGAVGPMFLVGDAVRGGLHGEPPSLSNLDNGNLRYSVDFRSVYAALLERWLEAPADAILGRHFEPLDVIAV